MEKEQMKMAILRQGQTFRHQVNVLHRVYQVQKQLMTEVHVVKMNWAQAGGDTQAEAMVETNHLQCYSNSGEKKPPPVEDFDLELTLATGSDRRKQEMGSNSDSGATVSSSTSAESELRQRFPESNVNGFKVRARGMMISTCSTHAVSLALCLSLTMA
ncbi:hypothetical protein BRADI_3g15120v3 [Brachypodium distachyon]|uniref:Uncharacterized protein n=1 Tax=Brachypodium distachyon TaxID=15368 RepID=I1I0Z3_BRADI|nr:hypothetical protein BRADI_3g15120v3 [Brachypodium distachyon]PNT66645.1 hypothetical protein BRADI_3g15120v3 [Brachypodium distachyon]